MGLLQESEATRMHDVRLCLGGLPSAHALVGASKVCT